VPDVECKQLRSPRLSRLETDVAASGARATVDFWREMGALGTPLVEPLEGGRESLITFLWRGSDDVHNVTVFGALAGFEDNRLHHLPGTDVWYRTYHAPTDFRGTYWMSPNDALVPAGEDGDWIERMASWQRDPLNPKTYRDFWYVTEPPTETTISILELPGAPPQPHVLPRAGAPHGSVAESVIVSQILGNERKVWVYTPPGYDASGPPCGLLLLFDGHAYSHLIPTPTILDNLVAAGDIQPVVAIMPDSLGELRAKELCCFPPFVDFLTTELLPWVQQDYHVTIDPARTVVAGSSYGGLAAAFAGLRRPDVFGNVLSQSGSFWWKPESDSDWEWITRQFDQSPRLPLRAHLDIGLFETKTVPGRPSQLESNRHLRDVLLSKRYSLHYKEFSGGHDTICWQGTLANGLLALIPAEDHHAEGEN